MKLAVAVTSHDIFRLPYSFFSEYLTPPYPQ